MEAAKAAVSKLTGNRGHSTSVEETVAPSITHEAVKPHRHEESTQAIDREVHQHHYHSTVQPLSHQERLPEKHTHNILPTENREFHHDDESATKERLAAEMANFKNQSTTHETRHTRNVAPTVTGEHVHHHVHETVIPVIHKETIQPEVIHTTIPVHEVHHAPAQHHGLSALPMKTLDEFKAGGGSMTDGGHTTHQKYEGAPRQYNDKLSTSFEKLEEKFHMSPSGSSGTTTASQNPTAGHNGNFSTGNLTGPGGLDEMKTTHRPTDSGISGVGNDLKSPGAGPGSASTTAEAKPGLADRLNPRVDADGDGKQGIID